MRCAGAFAVVGLALTACSPAHPSNEPDAPPTEIDAPIAGASLTLSLALADQLPQQITPDLRLTSVYLSATLVRAIADAGDASLTNCEMKWDSDDAPDPFTFKNPPIGTYSTVDLRLARREGPGPDRRAFELRGRYKGADFKIEMVDGTLTASPAVQMMLKAGTTQTVKLQLGLGPMLESIDWDLVDKQDGDYVLDDTDPQMPMVGYGLSIAFRSAGL